MNIFDDYTIKLLVALNQDAIEYIIVGGYAVNFHGYRRTTGDIDIWIKPDNDTKAKIIVVLRKLGVKENILEELKGMDFTKPLVFIDGEEPYKIDFMTYVSGVKFEDAWPKRILAKLDNISVPFIQFNQLILTKISSNRLKDKADVEELQRIQQLRNKTD